VPTGVGAATRGYRNRSTPGCSDRAGPPLQRLAQWGCQVGVEISAQTLSKLGKTADLATVVTATGLLKLAKESGNVALLGEYD